MKDFNTYLSEMGEVGYIEETHDSLVYASGLPKARPFEIVVFETGEIGQISNLKPELSEILIFSEKKISVGTRVARTGETLSVPVGFELLGQTIDALGRSLDKARVFTRPKTTRFVDLAPTGIENRKLISKPCETGIVLLDLIVPLGKGQRELVIGDRKTGKTQLVLQSVLTQVKQGTLCVFASIGQNNIHIKKIEAFFQNNKIENKVVLVASRAQDPPGLIHLTPYTAMTIAEFFRDEGLDVIIVFDDLTTHAKFYREIALLGRRFPGRNSYPSDIFYMHAKLLERAGNFVTQGKESSISCLAVVETLLGDLTGYIQTNLMSITDGHIYFDSDLFYRGQRPAVHPFLSVTRLGRQTQNKIAKGMNREIMAALTLYEKTKRYQRFGAELNVGSRLALAIGEFILAFFNQAQDLTISLNVQLVSFGMLWNGMWREKGIAPMKGDLLSFNKAYEQNKRVKKEVDDLVSSSGSFNELLKNLQATKIQWQT